MTAGLDAMTVGETQVLGQIRTAYGAACQAGAIGSTLHTLVQQALRVGKRVRTETDLDRTGHPPAGAEAILGRPGRPYRAGARLRLAGRPRGGRPAPRPGHSELVRMQTRLPNLDPTAREELARAVRRVVDKLLHTPTVRIKEQPSYNEALRELFLLDPRPATG